VPDYRDAPIRHIVIVISGQAVFKLRPGLVTCIGEIPASAILVLVRAMCRDSRMRFVTYLNDLSVAPTFVLGLEASYTFEMPSDGTVKTLKRSGNVLNLNNETGVSTAVVTGASGGYQAYPLPPRTWFMTVEAGL
jgi:hypothetical protein